MKLIIDIKVDDLKRAINFYTKILGLSLKIEESTWAAIKVGDAEIHLYKDGGVTGHVEFYVNNIDEMVVDLKKKGVEFVSGADKPSFIRINNDINEFPWGRTAFFKDSEGNELAVVKDN